MAWFKTGTINLTNNSDIVTGNGAGFNKSIRRGDSLVVNQLVVGEIDAVVNANQLKLVRPYGGTTAQNVAYAIQPTAATIAEVDDKIVDLLDTVADLIEGGGTGGGAGSAGKSAYELAVENGFVGTEQEWLESLKGQDGADGADGEAQPAKMEIINLTEASGQLAGATGVYMLVPVSTQAPGNELSQQASITIPFSNSNARVALYATTSLTGVHLVIGATNAPAQQPEVPTEPVNLSGSSTVYGPPGQIFPLGIDLANSTASFSISIPSGLTVRRAVSEPQAVPVASQWTTSNVGSPWPQAGSAVVSPLNRVGTGYSWSAAGNIIINQGTYLTSDSLGLEFPSVSDDTKTQAPARFKFSFKGVIPAGTGYAILAECYDYGIGRFNFSPHWDGNTMRATVGRGSSEQFIFSDASPTRVLGTNQLYEVEYVDDPNGVGGTVFFYIDGAQIGAGKPTDFKLRINPQMTLQVNASTGNTSNSIDNLEVEYIGISYDEPGVAVTYEPVSNGAISKEALEQLVVDATMFSTPQPAKTLTYTANGTQVTELSVVVGPIEVPSLRAYKAVLEDWSTGTGIAHANQLVMTKIAAQNCRFEDATLYGSQPAWIEVLPEGEVPNIGGINYYCEGIRMGNYVQFQFGYDWDAAQMPDNPFGSPLNKESYMVPHKWLIYDKDNTLLARVEQPDGQPLNTASSPAIWQGQYDGRGVAVITTNNRWYPKGTVRSGVVWRSHDPVEYTQQQIHSLVPTFDLAVPFGSQTNYSVNGFDFRLFTGSAGNDGQANGFGNSRWMSWEPTTYTEIQAAVANTLSPWKVGTEAAAATPNAGIWLKYTPFNQCGRSPVTGPGGTRDDRQIMPEMVGRYARDVDGTRLHDNLSYRDIALDYLTSYVSDPFHCFEGGRLRPLYKGNARRNITLRNHYYGPGELTTPASQAYYQQGGRTYEWVSSSQPLRVAVPYAGSAANKPMFGTNMIDQAHAHQFPHWGSLLFKSPEFAFLGHKLSDQCRLYRNLILNDIWGPGREASRDAAWSFMHAALMWKTASKNSDRLYSRAEVLDWVVFDFEGFYDTYYASTPGYLNPPTTVTAGDAAGLTFAATARFGPCSSSGYSVSQHDFFIGYWLSAIHAAERLGFNDALRAASPKAEAIVNWLITIHQRRVVGRINQGMELNSDGSDYMTPIWSEAQINAAGGVIANLPQTYAALVTAQGANKAPSWDTWKDGSTVYSRDGQAMDQLLAAPSLLRDMGRTAGDLTQAETTALSYRQSKITSETAKGANEAGLTWFRFHQITNNPPYKPA
jgi:hypothetical protein